MALFRPLAINIGLRYARSRRSFISFVTFVALSGLALSVAVLLFVQAVVAGFERELKERVLGVVPHVTIRARGALEDFGEIGEVGSSIPEVAGSAPIVEGSALLSTGQSVLGVALSGVDPSRYAAVSTVGRYVSGLAIDDMRPGRFEIAIGVKAAERLGLKLGDPVTVVLPEATVTPLGLFPRRKRFTVTGIVDTGSQLDQRHAYAHIEDAARLYRLGPGVHGVQFRLADPLRARWIGAEIIARLPEGRYYATTWFRAHGGLYSAIRVQKGMMFLLLSLLVAVAAFNLVSTLVMVVNERRGDVAILRTLGGGRGLVMGAFVFLGMVISSVGVALGVGLGLVLGVAAEALFPWLERVLDMELMGEYLVRSLPVQFNGADVLNVALVASALALGSTIYPAWRAASLNPALILQHE